MRYLDRMSIAKDILVGMSFWHTMDHVDHSLNLHPNTITVSHTFECSNRDCCEAKPIENSFGRSLV